MKSRASFMLATLTITLSTIAACKSNAIATASECKSRIATHEVTANNRVVIFGEKHGTENSPEYFYNVVCNVVSDEGKVTIVGLEYLDSENSALQRYLASNGTESDKAELTSRPNWNYPNKDGRESLAMLQLIENLRVLTQRHPKLIVVPIDPDLYWERGITRDSGMAMLLQKAIEDYPDAVSLVLVGDFHAMRLGQAGVKRTLIENLEIPSKSYRFVESGGTAWMCTGDREKPTCEVSTISENGEYGNEITMSLSEALYEQGYDGAINLGRLRASLPVNK